jgi:hypothetical protein
MSIWQNNPEDEIYTPARDVNLIKNNPVEYERRMRI